MNLRLHMKQKIIEKYDPTAHMDSEIKIIDNYYFEKCKKLEDRNDDLQNELVELRLENKKLIEEKQELIDEREKLRSEYISRLISLEEDYKEEIEAISKNVICPPNSPQSKPIEIPVIHNKIPEIKNKIVKPIGKIPEKKGPIKKHPIKI